MFAKAACNLRGLSQRCTLRVMTNLSLCGGRARVCREW